VLAGMTVVPLPGPDMQTKTLLATMEAELRRLNFQVVLAGSGERSAAFFCWESEKKEGEQKIVRNFLA